MVDVETVNADHWNGEHLPKNHTPAQIEQFAEMGCRGCGGMDPIPPC